MLNIIFYNDFKDNEIPQKTKKCNLTTLIDGTGIFAGNFFGSGTELTSFSENLSSLKIGKGMFRDNGYLNLFTSNLSSLVNGENMFSGCTLEEFNSNLNSLENGSHMFYGCYGMESFNIPLSSLVCGINMFWNCTSLKSVKTQLPSLIDGEGMFCSGYRDMEQIDYLNLESFNADLPSLINGGGMFYYSRKLTDFTSSLPSLITGMSMFVNCRLNPASVLNIIDSLPNLIEEKEKYISGEKQYVSTDELKNGFMTDGRYSYVVNCTSEEPYKKEISASAVGELHLGIGVTPDSKTINQQLQTFAEEATFNSWAELKQALTDKGWSVSFSYGGVLGGYNGMPSNTTLSEDEQFRGTPVYARLIEVTPEGEEYTEKEKASAEYCTEDGTKYYNIDWGHDVTDYSQYEYFGSLLEACGYYGVIPKKYLEEV